ncbi:MAG TPA: MFS transporter [Pyrinomonadaceae bacterium]|nr:MFS transporter [Pyrinomonadaceae bacterium]
MTLPVRLQKAARLALPGLCEVRPRLRTLLSGFACTTTAQFLFSSVMAVHLLSLGLSPTAVGLVTFCFYTGLRWQGPVAGLLIEKYGVLPVYAAGVLLSAAGYAGFTLGASAAALSSAAAAVGVGLGLDSLCRSVILVREGGSKEGGNRALALQYVLFNVAVTVGPLLSTAALLAGRTTREVFIAAASIHGAVGAAFLLFLPLPASAVARAARGSVRRSVRAAWQDRAFRSLLLRLPPVWFVFSVMQSVVPVFLSEWVHVAGASITSAFSLNALLVVLLGYRVQSRLVGLLEGHGLSKLYGVALGCVLMGGGIFSLLLAPRMPWASVYLFIIIFTMGELCFVPIVQAVVNDSVPEGEASQGLYFGMAKLAWGVGAGLSNLVGGFVIEACRRHGYAYLPLLFGGAAVAVSVYYLRLAGRERGRARPFEGEATRLAAKLKMQEAGAGDGPTGAAARPA